MPLSSALSRPLFFASCAIGAWSAGRAAELEFNRDIRPILSENCFHCHGQDASKREAKLRLDERESALRSREGLTVIVPGKPDESELIQRITSKDPAEVMPPPDSHKSLTPVQVDLLRRWIAEGAAYQKHWAFETPRRVAPPVVRDAKWPRHAIDRFVLARLEWDPLESTCRHASLSIL